MNINLPKFQKLSLEEMKFIPLWYVNGSLQSNAKFTELFTTFEILIHILSKRFISFKSQILAISSTFIQMSQERKYTVENYAKMSQADLISLLSRKDAKIFDLEDKINRVLMNNDQLISEVSGLKSTINDQSNKIDNLESTNQGLNYEIGGLRKDVGKILSNVSLMVSTTYSCYKDINNQITEKIPEKFNFNQIYIRSISSYKS